MLGRPLKGSRGKIQAQTMLLAGVAMLLAAMLIAFWAMRTGESKKEEAE